MRTVQRYGIQVDILYMDQEKARLVPIFIKLPPQHIVAIKFIIESYDGLGVVRTLNPATGEAVILALDDTIGEVQNILSAAGPGIGLRQIPPPLSLSDDWLLQGEDY